MFIAFVGLIAITFGAITTSNFFLNVGFGLIGFDVVLELSNLNGNTARNVNNAIKLHDRLMEMLEKIKKDVEKIGQCMQADV